MQARRVLLATVATLALSVAAAWAWRREARAREQLGLRRREYRVLRSASRQSLGQAWVAGHLHRAEVVRRKVHASLDLSAQAGHARARLAHDLLSLVARSWPVAALAVVCCFAWSRVLFG